MLDKFCYGFLNRVYNCDDYTQLEINSKLIQKIDEIIDQCNNAFEFVEWLKEQGVPNEVQSIINTMLENGTLENLININKINELKTELTNNINEFKTSTNQSLQTMNNTVDTKINENKELINQSKIELNNSMTEYQTQTNSIITNFKDEVNNALNVFRNIKICKNLTEFKNAISISETKPTIIYLVQGDYTLDSTIYIPSNTKIVGLGKVNIKSTGLNCYFSNKTNGQAIAYNGTKNIKIENITFDGLDSANGLTLVGIGHAENVTIENCEFKNLHMWHMIEFNAVFNGYIRNCKFDNYGNVGSNGTEAIQLDAMISSQQFPWFGNYDNVANKHIIIEGNSFSNIGVKCIGNHSFANGVIQKDIFINNNTFDNVHTGISINDFDNLNVTNNSSTSCRFFLITQNESNSSKNLNIVGNTHRGNYGISTEELGDERFIAINMRGNNGDFRVEFVNITNNHISSCSGHGIGYTANYVTIANNDFFNIARHGIYHFGGLSASISNNTFKNAGKEDGRYAIVTGNNSVEKSEGIIINGNSIPNLRGIQVNTNSTKIIVSNNASRVENNVSTDCTVVNNVAIV